MFAPSMDVSGDFAEVASPDEVRLIFRHVASGWVEPSLVIHGDSLTLSEQFVTDDSIVVPSEIIVERIFRENSDTSVIVKSNNPWLNSAILRKVAWFTKQYLSSGNPEVKHFFIQYRLTRNTYNDCGVWSKEY